MPRFARAARDELAMDATRHEYGTLDHRDTLLTYALWTKPFYKWTRGFEVLQSGDIARESLLNVARRGEKQI